MASPRSAQTRKSRTDEKVFRATIDLLRSEGSRAVTIEAVAAASGVAKTTIYRRHADRIAMLQAALEHYVPQVGAIADEDPRSGLLALTEAMSQAIESYLGTSVAALVTATDDPATAVVRAAVIEPRVQQITAMLERWKAAGALRGDLDVDLAVSTILGTSGVTYARHGSFPERWPQRLVEHLWPLLRPAQNPTGQRVPSARPRGRAGEKDGET